MVNDHIKTFGINLNAQHLNGMTPFELINLKLLVSIWMLNMWMEIGMTPFELALKYGY